MQTKYRFKNFHLATISQLPFPYLVYRVAHDGRESSKCFDGFTQVLAHAQGIADGLLEVHSPQELRARFRAVDIGVEVYGGEAVRTARVLSNASRFDLESLLGHDHRMAYLVGPDNVASLLREYRTAVFEYEQGRRSMTEPVLRPSGGCYSKSQHLDLCGMSNLMHALVLAGVLEVSS